LPFSLKIDTGWIKGVIVSANAPFYLGGTSLLIAVVVVMDFMAQVQSHLLSSQYQSLMKKANLKGYKR
jgi:preprotein translocase subunit SecY